MHSIRSIIKLLLLSMVICFASCNNSTGSSTAQNVDIRGTWLFSKTTYTIVQSWKDSTDAIEEKDTTITIAETDTTELMEITDSNLIICYYNQHYSSDFYTKYEIPYELSGTMFVGEMFTGSEAEDEYNYANWKTSVSKEIDHLIIQTHYEEKRGNKTEWEKIESIDSYYYLLYSGNSPHESWPDSCYLDLRRKKTSWVRRTLQ